MQPNPKTLNDELLIKVLIDAAFVAGIKYGQDKEAAPEYKEQLERQALCRDEVLSRLSKLAAVTAQRDAAVEVLKAVEWSGGVCPSCYRFKTEGHHTSGCQLAAALAKAEAHD